MLGEANIDNELLTRLGDGIRALGENAAQLQGVTSADSSQDDFRGGYFNSTSAIDAIQFKMSTGNIDSGLIKLYGIKDS